MTIFLRQSTASQEIPLGYFVDSTDGNTEETALTINNTDIKVWKTGATTLANKNSGGATHISNGIYYAVLDETDTDTIGPLRVFVHVSGALSVKVDCVVLDEAVFDALFGTVALATATNITAAAGITLADGAITAAKIATDAIDDDAIAASAITEIQAGLSTLDAAGIRTAVGLASANLDTQLAAIDDYIDTEIAAIYNALTAAHAEPTGAPAANESIVDKIGYLFAALRNGLTVTATTKTFQDDAGATLWSKTLSDNGTTYTETEGA